MADEVDIDEFDNSCWHCRSATDKGASAHCSECIHFRSLWTWTDGSPVANTFWVNDEPSDYKCALSGDRFYPNNGWIADERCGSSFNFVCKRCKFILYCYPQVREIE